MMETVLQKDFFRLLTGFSTKKYPNYVFAEFSHNITHEIEQMFVFFSIGVELCHKSTILQPFMLNMRLLAVTILKCSDLLPQMSGILDTNIPTFCNSGWKSIYLSNTTKSVY